MTEACATWTMTPVSGGPAAPGVTITAHPMLTGGPGIAVPLPSLSRREVRGARQREERALHRGRGSPLELGGGLALHADRQALDLHVRPRLDRDAARGLEGQAALAVHLGVGR